MWRWVPLGAALCRPSTVPPPSPPSIHFIFLESINHRGFQRWDYPLRGRPPPPTPSTSPLPLPSRFLPSPINPLIFIDTLKWYLMAVAPISATVSFFIDCREEKRERERERERRTEVGRGNRKKNSSHRVAIDPRFCVCVCLSVCHRKASSTHFFQQQHYFNASVNVYFSTDPDG